MRKIKFLHIICGLICIILFVVFVIMVFFERIFFIPALCAIIGYMVIDKKYLRFPNYQAFTNIDRLL